MTNNYDACPILIVGSIRMIVFLWDHINGAIGDIHK
jgi:hypothetical protein